MDVSGISEEGIMSLSFPASRMLAMLPSSFRCAAVALAAALVAPAFAASTPLRQGTAGNPTDRIIVKLKAQYRDDVTQVLRSDRISVLSARAQIPLRAIRPMSDQAQVLALPAPLRSDVVQLVVNRLRQDPTVEYAFVDARERLMAVPNDSLYNQQTYLQAPGAAPLVSAANAPGAWDITKGNANAIVAIVDGGIRFDHPDFAGRLFAGYDFVSADCTPGTGSCTTANQYTSANDGDGRDPDASDPGDWVTASEISTNPILTDCVAEDSSWHGTHIAGIVGAAGNNAIGIAGLNWNANLLPVRVAGKCGAYRSDVIDGIRWAAGIAVPGVPANPHVAKIINVSLGSEGDCNASAYKSTIADVLAAGAIVVAAAGNEDGPVIQPANCTGVISVGAVRGDGMRSVYSNTGSNLTIMAPGGDYYSATNDRLISTNNSGRTTPIAYSSTGFYSSLAGTSFSTPVVSGVVSLMLSANSSLTSAQVLDILRTTARAFVAVAGNATCVPGGNGNVNGSTPCNCTTAACGAGYVDATAAVSRAFSLGGGTVTPPPVTTPPPASSGGGGGGGGSIDPLALLILASIAFATRSLRSRAPVPSHERERAAQRDPHH